MKRSIRDAIRRIAWSGVSLPVRARVRSSFVARRAGGYGCTAEVLDRTGAATGEVLESLPLSPIWLGADGRGIYAAPAAGQVVIVDWIDGDRSQPYIAAMDGAANVPAADAAAGPLVLTDGGGTIVKISGRRVSVASSQQSLVAALERIVDAVAALVDTAGHTIAPPSWPAAALKQRLRQVLDD